MAIQRFQSSTAPFRVSRGTGPSSRFQSEMGIGGCRRKWRIDMNSQLAGLHRSWLALSNSTGSVMTAASSNSSALYMKLMSAEAEVGGSALCVVHAPDRFPLLHQIAFVLGEDAATLLL